MKKSGFFIVAAAALFAQTLFGQCDLNSDGVVNVVDVQLGVNQALKLAACSVDLDADGACNVVDVQRVISAALGGPCGGSTTNSLTIYEVDAALQTNRPISFGRVFAQGEIAQCPQPVIGGSAVTNYQADVKNRWSDGSVKYAVISFTQTLSAKGATTVTFNNAASCNNTGFLSQAQMAGFNNGNWGAQIDVTAGGVTRSANAKTMLTALSFGECQLNYWLKGPVVTQVIVQDCAEPFSFDFGWQWNGLAMKSTTVEKYQSLHPIFILSFYPGSNQVKVDYILENMWSGRFQDQRYSFALQAGNPLAPVYNKGVFTQAAGTRWRKTLWSGPATGHIRIDHNFAYLISSKAFPNYDRKVQVNPDADYLAFVAGDKGDIGGAGLAAAWGQGYSDNHEGAPLQREELEYLYNMNTCGAANGKCAKAWFMLTGERGNMDGSIAPNVSGGAGVWATFTNAPFHMRESRTSASFYCPGYAARDATASSPCGAGMGAAAGRSLSRHAYPNAQFYDLDHLPVTPVGAATAGGWQVDLAHWLDYAYTPYLLTGDYYYLDEEYQGASFAANNVNPANGLYWQSHGFFAYMNPSSGPSNRAWAWGMQTVGRAAFIAPDGSPEANYYRSVLDSNLAVQEGFMNITGTGLTPARINSSCASYNPDTANRWDWGRCTVGQCAGNPGLCTTPPLHNIAIGYCPINAIFINTANATDAQAPWMYWYVSVALSHLRELGFVQTQSVVTNTWQRLIEMVQDPTFNPYLIAAYSEPLKKGPAACPGSGSSTTNPFLGSWAQVKKGYSSGLQTINTFNKTSDAWSGNYPCADHGYSLLARAAGTYISGTNSGSFSGSSAWNWLKANVPYSTCGDSIIKYALAPR